MSNTTGEVGKTCHDGVEGEARSLTSTLLAGGAATLQSFAPVKHIHEHLCGFHFYAHDMTRQVEAHHYCNHQNEEMWQCVIYDSDEANARLIGIEYVVSEKIFQGLPDEEKKLWHSHAFEVKGGSLVLPRLPVVAETKALARLAKTYGKTWHTWQVDRGDTVPLGVPQLMSAFTAEGQLRPELKQRRDEKYNISTEDRVQAREGIETPEVIDPLADYWQSGRGLQLEVKETEFKQI